ncbi:hypothetical protein EMIHUDRAFT_50467, partial [Emiliania huxleyi CCMP1516]|uniref:Heat shock protein 70 n=3 Tax=Emiliania huxleyi TaxID=2903 RepID=A0A0D3IEK7_EMIH1
LGLDVGGSSSVIAVARRGGVDVLVNEATERSTPSLVGFDGRRRRLGLSASATRSRSPEDVIAPKRLVGPKSAESLQPRPAVSLKTSGDGSVSAEVEYCGQRRTFTAVQLFAMLLRHLAATAERDHGSALREAVIAVPHRYSAEQRQAVLDAARLAG